MMNLWELPKSATFDGKTYGINCDFRDILEIFSYLGDPELPDFVKWQIALGLFYQQEIPPSCRQEAMAYFDSFVRMGQGEADRPGPQLLCWEQDAPVIIGEVNRVAGCEIREKPFLHWWTFLSWFHAVGEGQLSFLVSLREKLRKGQKLEPWEQDYYRENRKKVDIPQKESGAQRREKEALLALLDGRKEQVN